MYKINTEQQYHEGFRHELKRMAGKTGKRQRSTLLLSQLANAAHRTQCAYTTQEDAGMLGNTMIRLRVVSTTSRIWYSPCRSCTSLSSSTQKHVSDAKPLIVVFGWLGCIPRRLGKYIKIYENEKLETISYILPMASYVFPSIARKASRELFNQLSLTPSRPLLFHILSGNGVYIYAHLMRHCAHDPADDAATAQRKRDVLARIAGCIVDSAPPRYDRDTFTRGFVGAILDLSTAHFRKLPSLSPHKPPSASSSNSSLPRYTHPVLTPLAGGFFSALLSVPSFSRNFEEAKVALLKTQPSKIPQLFIYSKVDQLIPYYDVEYYIKLYEEAGFDVKKHCFEDSPHVSHLLYHPTQYIELVRNFMKSISFIKK
eukprot:Phypoly_transcript_07422.p1 GENE.Phypoly_transcript_07422~~Phypoly_transcript_07422.p1  ORF type:complete len:371 (+),score=66.37 Phypoly_transcript_07422:525-1637(+)